MSIGEEINRNPFAKLASPREKKIYICPRFYYQQSNALQVLESVDISDLESEAARREGSIPFLGIVVEILLNPYSP